MKKPESTIGPIHIFIAYAQQERRIKEQLVNHLHTWERQGRIKLWDSQQITVGLTREEEITTHIKEASIAIVLLSADILNHEYYESDEMLTILERKARKELIIAPIYIRDVNLQGTPFEGLQLLPRNYKAIKYQQNRDRYFVEITRELDYMLEEIRSR